MTIVSCRVFIKSGSSQEACKMLDASTVCLILSGHSPSDSVPTPPPPLPPPPPTVQPSRSKDRAGAGRKEKDSGGRKSLKDNPVVTLKGPGG